MKEHAAGRLVGAIPHGWLKEFQVELCLQCNKLVAQKRGGKHNSYCQSCAWARRGTDTVTTSGRAAHPSAPSLEASCQAGIGTRRRVPTAARRVWGDCLIKALKEILTHNDVRAWADFFALAKMCLPASQGKEGSEHTAAGFAIKERCERWKRGERGILWDDGKKNKTRPGEKKAKDTLAGNKAVSGLEDDAQDGVPNSGRAAPGGYHG